MKPNKVVIIGACSMFGPCLIENFVQRAAELGKGTLVLVDINSARLEIITRFAKRKVQASKIDFKIESTTDRCRALKDADFVIIAISVGGEEALRFDILLPSKHGIYYERPDTVGPGAIFRSLRHIPLILEICHDMEELCPDAWLLNFSNPMSCICRAMSQTTKVKFIGLCPGYMGMAEILARVLDVKREELQLYPVGINHFTWLLDIRLRGEDAYPLLREKEKQLRTALGEGVYKMFQLFGYIPSPGWGHIAEFCPFCKKEVPLEVRERKQLSHVDKRVAERTIFWEKLAKEAKQTEHVPTIPDLASWIHDGANMAIGIINSITNNKEETYVVNIPNQGAVANLPMGAIVEVPAVIGAYGIRALCMGNLPEGVVGLVQSHIAHQNVVVKAALNKSKRELLQALLTDPCITYSLEDARKLLDEMLSAEAKYLPEFQER